MTVVVPHPTLQAIVEAAVDATAASRAWLLATEGDELSAVVVADPVTAQDPTRPTSLAIGVTDGSAGYVLSSGQPLALDLRHGGTGPWAREHPLLGRVPDTILSVPCQAGSDVVGVLELLDKVGGPFSFDDVEVVTLLGSIAAAALADGALMDGRALPHPDELGRELSQLFVDDPPQYARIAVVLQGLLSGG